MVLARLPLLSLVSVYSPALVGLGEAPVVPSHPEHQLGLRTELLCLCFGQGSDPARPCETPGAHPAHS